MKRKVASTNDWAKKLARLGAEEGVVTVAETQTAGRGRLGRKWFSPRGGLWFSVVLRPKKNARDAAKLVFVAGLAVAEVLHAEYGLKAETKWPNDVLVNGKKICGILAEMSTRAQEVNYVVLGIGINANTFPKIVPESIKATSIERELGRQICLEELLVATLEKMEKIYKRYEESQFCSVLAEWKELACFLGKRVRVISGNESFQGVAVNVDNDGVLVLRLEDGTTKWVFSGDLIIEQSKK